jgi:hypothetical protein
MLCLGYRQRRIQQRHELALDGSVLDFVGGLRFRLEMRMVGELANRVWIDDLRPLTKWECGAEHVQRLVAFAWYTDEFDLHIKTGEVSPARSFTRFAG